MLDVFSRRVVGWKASRSMTADLVVAALDMAAWTRRHTTLEGLTCHTDAGSQYTSVSYTDRIDDIGAPPSIGTVGDSFDNAMAESMMGTFKTELYRNPAVLSRNGGHWKGLDDLEIETCAWVSWFNEERLHSELGDVTPAEFEANYVLESQAVRREESKTTEPPSNPVRFTKPRNRRLLVTGYIETKPGQQMDKVPPAS